MSRNDAQDFAQRLYARVPADYRARDAERNQPLLALLRVIGEQVAHLRGDMDALWDNFFIETCDDWVVPYIGALLGTHLMMHPVGQSDRLDVWNTIVWRRSKGTPQMLRALVTAISEWPADLTEFFQQLGWSQNMNHPRPHATLTPGLRDQYRLSLLGHAADPFAHAADFAPSYPLDQARVSRHSLGVGRGAWSTRGRYQIKNLGLFVRRLQTFPINGATPAAVAPGAAIPVDASCFTFDPLYREIPLFAEQSRVPITRAAFDHAPWETFGQDVGVRQFGVLLASGQQPEVALSSSHSSFTFGGAGSGLSLRPEDGIRLLQPGLFQLGGVHFVISAEWQQDGGSRIGLGLLSTFYAATGRADAFHPGAAATGPGRLVLTVQTGRSGLGSWGPPEPTTSQAGRFPGALLAIRAARTGPLRVSDGLYVYLRPGFLRPTDKATYFVADDGSTYFSADLATASLARASEGQVYPPRSSSPDVDPASAFTSLSRGPRGMRVLDASRFGGTGVLIQAELFTGSLQQLGAVATVDQTPADYPQLAVPNPWPGFSYGANPHAIGGDQVPGLLTIFVKPLSGGALHAQTRRARLAASRPAAASASASTSFVPAAEIVVTNRRGQGLLVYLPEVPDAPGDGVRFFVAADGSTYFVPPDSAAQQAALAQESLAGLDLARQALGQVLPIRGTWPLEQRRPVAINLCRCERSALLRPGELGIDPELGRFAFAALDPAIGQGGLSVDFVEAFSERVGALNFDRQLDPSRLATRLVSQSGDAGASVSAQANAPVHQTVSAALAAAQDGDVIEIVDSATYAESTPTVLGNAAVRALTLRAAAHQRPCLTYYSAANVPAPASLLVASAMSLLELNGLLISGGPIGVQATVRGFTMVACTLNPDAGALSSLVDTSTLGEGDCEYSLCRCITGGLRLGAAVSRLTVADSIVDQQGGFALAAASPIASPPVDLLPLPANASVQLERVTVLGRILCDVLDASECLLDEIVQVEDQQTGCIRFSRFELSSVLPRRFRCIPTDEVAAVWPTVNRCMSPLFNSRRFGRPDYAQLALAGLASGVPQKLADMTRQEKMRFGQSEILTASEAGAEVGAFASTLNAIRINNLGIKLQEFMPVGLSAVIIAET